MDGAYWWGIEFLAESDEDKTILETFRNSLPAEAVHKYDEGTFREVCREDGRVVLLTFDR